MSVGASKESVIHQSPGCICVVMRQLHTALAAYFDFYNLARPHHRSTISCRRKSASYSDSGRPHLFKCTLLYLFRGLAVVANHRVGSGTGRWPPGMFVQTTECARPVGQAYEGYWAMSRPSIGYSCLEQGLRDLGDGGRAEALPQSRARRPFCQFRRLGATAATGYSHTTPSLSPSLIY